MVWSPAGQTKKTVTLIRHRVHRKTQALFFSNAFGYVDALHLLLRAYVVLCTGLLWRSLPFKHGQHAYPERNHSESTINRFESLKQSALSTFHRVAAESTMGPAGHSTHLTDSYIEICTGMNVQPVPEFLAAL
jgi:hypothetical protein